MHGARNGKEGNTIRCNNMTLLNEMLCLLKFLFWTAVGMICICLFSIFLLLLLRRKIGIYSFDINSYAFIWRYLIFFGGIILTLIVISYIITVVLYGLT